MAPVRLVDTFYFLPWLGGLTMNDTTESLSAWREEVRAHREHKNQGLQNNTTSVPLVHNSTAVENIRLSPEPLRAYTTSKKQQHLQNAALNKPLRPQEKVARDHTGFVTTNIEATRPTERTA